MKTAMMILAASLMTGALAFAQAETESKATTDHSTNPITGTKTTVKKHKKAKKGEHAETEEMAKETTKEYKDGTSKTTKKTETTTETK